MLLYGCGNGEHGQFSGYVEGENIYLASPFYGVLKQLAVIRGQKVEKGTLLFKLDASPQDITILQVKAELAQAQNTLFDMKKPKREPEIAAIKAQIEQAESRINLAKIRVSRYEKLIAKRATDQDTVDAAITNLQQELDSKDLYLANLALALLGSRDDQIKAQQAQVDSLVAKLNEARWELAQKTLIAPATGVIFDTYFRQGEYVAAQQPVLSLLTPENIRIEFFVPLDYLSKLHVGQKITFDCEGCAPDNAAVINYVSPDAEYLPPLVYSRENNSKLVFRIKAQMKQPTLFKPGQPVTVHLND